MLTTSTPTGSTLSTVPFLPSYFTSNISTSFSSTTINSPAISPMTLAPLRRGTSRLPTTNSPVQSPPPSELPKTWSKSSSWATTSRAACPTRLASWTRPPSLTSAKTGWRVPSPGPSGAWRASGTWTWSRTRCTVKFRRRCVSSRGSATEATCPYRTTTSHRLALHAGGWSKQMCWTWGTIASLVFPIKGLMSNAPSSSPTSSHARIPSLWITCHAKSMIRAGTSTAPPLLLLVRCLTTLWTPLFIASLSLTSPSHRTHLLQLHALIIVIVITYVPLH